MKWTETSIARALALQTFNRKNLVVVPNCTWTGYECDLLVVAPDLRIIDVEVKISRADLKADAKKDKWWHREFAGYEPYEYTGRSGNVISKGKRAIYNKIPRRWPPKVWKHYYAMPKEIWKPELTEFINERSGILLLSEQQGYGVISSASQIVVSVERQAKPNRDAEKISPAAAVDIARLASLRMWESYRQVDELRKEAA